MPSKYTYKNSLCLRCGNPMCEWMLSGGEGRTPCPMTGQKVFPKLANGMEKVGGVVWVTTKCPLYFKSSEFTTRNKDILSAT